MQSWSTSKTDYSAKLSKKKKNLFEDFGKSLQRCGKK